MLRKTLRVRSQQFRLFQTRLVFFRNLCTEALSYDQFLILPAFNSEDAEFFYFNSAFAFLQPFTQRHVVFQD